MTINLGLRAALSPAELSRGSIKPTGELTQTCFKINRQRQTPNKGFFFTQLGSVQTLYFTLACAADGNVLCDVRAAEPRREWGEAN